MVLTGLTYHTLDREIIARIQDGHATASQIEGGAAGEEALNLQRELHSPSFRIIDRRLQALRKAGKITYDRRAGWALVDKQEGA